MQGARQTAANRAGRLVSGVCYRCESNYQIDVGTLDCPDIEHVDSPLLPRVFIDEASDLFGWQMIGGVSYIGSAEHILVNSRIMKMCGITVPPESLLWPRMICFGPTEVRIMKEALCGVASRPEKIAVASRLSYFGRAGILHYALAQDVGQLGDLWKSHYRENRRFTQSAIASSPFSMTTEECSQLTTLMREYDTAQLRHEGFTRQREVRQ